MLVQLRLRDAETACELGNSATAVLVRVLYLLNDSAELVARGDLVLVQER